MVDWLHRNVEGFVDRREARKYAGNLLKAGYIRHTINKVTFSEQCYYVFGDLCEGEDKEHLLLRLLKEKELEGLLKHTWAHLHRGS